MFKRTQLIPQLVSKLLNRLEVTCEEKITKFKKTVIRCEYFMNLLEIQEQNAFDFKYKSAFNVGTYIYLFNFILHARLVTESCMK